MPLMLPLSSHNLYSNHDAMIPQATTLSWWWRLQNGFMTELCWQKWPPPLPPGSRSYNCSQARQAGRQAGMPRHVADAWCKKRTGSTFNWVSGGPFLYRTNDSYARTEKGGKRKKASPCSNFTRNWLRTHLQFDGVRYISAGFSSLASDSHEKRVASFTREKKCFVLDRRRILHLSRSFFLSSLPLGLGLWAEVSNDV